MRSIDDTLDVHDAAEGSAELRSSMGAGFRWIGTFRLIGQVAQVLSLFVLARLLDPAEFGIVATASLVTQFFDRVLGDTGTSAAIVRNKEITQGLVSTVFFMNLAFGLTTFGALVVAGGIIARILGDAEAANVLRVLGLLAVINSAGYVQLALLRRMLEFKKLAIVTFSAVLTTALSTVAFAAAGFEEWSLVFGTLAGASMSLILAWTLSSWRPSFCFLPDRLREISTFSGTLTIQNFFNYFSFSGDRIVVSTFLGREALGFYGFANRMVRYPVDTAGQTYREVVMPNLARLQDDHAAMLMAYRRTVAGMTFILVPLCFILAAVADPFVATLLDPKWEPAAEVVAIVALVGGVRSISMTIGSVYHAKGRADLSLIWNIISSIVLVSSYLIGKEWGIEGVAIGALISLTLLTWPGLWLPLRLIDAKPSQVMAHVWENLVAATAAGAAAYFVQDLVNADAAKLFLGLAVGGAIYLAFALTRKPMGYRDLRALTSGGLKREALKPDDLEDATK